MLIDKCKILLELVTKRPVPTSCHDCTLDYIKEKCLSYSASLLGKEKALSLTPHVFMCIGLII